MRIATERKRRWSTVFIVAGSAAILVGAVVGIAVSVTSRRHQRDIRFGIEQLDVLIEDGRLEEASEMTRWLAGRAGSASDGLRVLRRAREVAALTSDPVLLADSARLVVSEFPANHALQEIYVYALVRAGSPREALAYADRRLVAGDDASLYAWTLLSAAADDESIDTAGRATDERAFLTGLSTESTPEQYVAAFERTGDWRYAADAAMLYMRAGNRSEAADTAFRASLGVRSPGLASRIYYDAGRHESALEAIQRIPATSRDSEGDLLEADLYLMNGSAQAARAMYESLYEERRPSETVYTNLAWLTDDDELALAFLRTGSEVLPDSWRIREQYAVRIAQSDLNRAFEAVDQLIAGNTSFDEDASLLRLKLEPNSVRRGYATAIWTLLEQAENEDTYRYAAWYFLNEGSVEDLQRVLRWASTRLPQTGAWLNAYRAVAAARSGRWSDSSDEFTAAFARDPQWYWAIDDAIVSLRALQTSEARARVEDALLLARNSSEARTALVFVVAARLCDDRLEAYALLDEAKERDPDNQDARMLRYQLDAASR